MSTTPQLLPIEFNYEQIKNTMLTNLIKMLTARKLLKQENMAKNIEKLINLKTDLSINDNPLYEISLDNIEQYYDNSPESKVMVIQMFKDKISGIKAPAVAEFLNKYKNNPKIMIVKDISKKTADQIISEFKYAEIFWNDQLMIDAASHVSVPKHILLTETEAKAVLEEYRLKKKELPKIRVKECMAQYYNAKVGQIFRIIRPSETAVEAPYYRIVGKGEVTAK